MYLGGNTGNTFIRQKLNVSSDVSLNSNVFIGNNLTVNGQLTVKQYTTQQTVTTISYEFIVGEDMSLNGRLFITGDTSMNSRLLVGSDASLNARLFVAGDTSMNSRLLVGSDASLNARLFVEGDTSMNARLLVGSDASLNGKMFVAGDISMNARLFVASDASFNGNIKILGNTLFLGNVNLTSKVTNLADVSMNNRIYVGSDASLNGNVYIYGDTSMNSRLLVGSDASLNARLFVVGDTSMNSRLLVGSDVSMGGNLFTKNITITGTINGYSTPLTTLDPWVLTNLFNAPSSVTFATANITSSYIYIPWVYPTQINVGFLNSGYLPVINSLTVNYSTTVNGSTTNILYNKTDASYVNTTPASTNSYYSNINTSSPITGIILAKSNTSGSVGTNLVSYNSPNTIVNGVQFPGESNTRNAYIYYDATINAFTNSSHVYLHVYYKNNNISYNDSYYNSFGFTTAGTPSAPRNLSAGTVSSGSISITYFDPSYGDVNNTSSSMTVNNYQINYNATANTVRYNGMNGFTTTNTMTGGHSPTNTTVIPGSDPTNNTTVALTSNIYPETSYSITVAAENTINLTYGTTSSPFTVTTLPFSSPSTSYNISTVFPTNNLTNGTYYSVATKNTVNNLIVESSATSRTTSTIPFIINDYTTRGNYGNGNTTTLSVTITGASSITGPSVNFSAAFPGTLPSALTANGITITPQSVNDYYSSSSVGNIGYYLQGNATITLGSSILSPSSNAYTVSLTRISSGKDSNNNATTYTGNSYSFYYDNLTTSPGTPSITSFTINSASYAYVCGIQVMYGSPNFKTSYTVTNLGNYFYKSPLIQYSSSDAFNNSIISASETSIPDGNTTNNKLNSSVSFINRSITANSTNTVFTTSIPLSIVASNINGDSSIGVATSIAALIDGPSYVLAYSTFSTTSIPNIGTSSSTIGTRIWSGTTPNLFNSTNLLNGSSSYSTLNPLYDHSQPITTGNYGNELQIANGKFQTYGNTNTTAYLNYSSLLNNSLNYSQILSTPGTYRYATFVWQIPQTTSSSYTSVTFTLNGVSSTPSVSSSTAYIGNEPIILYYRMEDATNATTLSIGKSITTDWINANSKTGTYVNSSNYTNTSNEPFYGISNTGGITGTTFSVLIPARTWTLNTYLYCRIGLPMDQTFSFTSISAILGNDTA